MLGNVSYKKQKKMRENFKQLTVRDRTWRKYDMYVIFKYILILGRERLNDYSGDREKWEFHLK